MVERLKIAIDKARAARSRTNDHPEPQALTSSQESTPEVSLPVSGTQTAIWDRLISVELDPARLERNRIITHDRTHNAHVAFDVLRTRILRTFRRHGWRRLGITSPGKGCGKTFTAINLALSMSRQRDCRTVLMDMDLRAPSVARVLGIADAEPVSWFFSGEVTPEAYLRRAGENLALGLNTKRLAEAGEVIQAPKTVVALDAMMSALDPDVVIYDLPPMLACDDVIGFLGQLDCVLLVVGGGLTRPAEVTECERLLTDETHLLGVLLNRAEGSRSTQYGYDAS